jgi:hypothetical protein
MERSLRDKLLDMMRDAAADEHGFWAWLDELVTNELNMLIHLARDNGLMVVVTAEGGGDGREAVYIRPCE